ncbi:MAG: histidinol dehydrogenase [Clostridia bacterium]|nr:histidinol dehydrogenase [Clostridia bacterium]
MKIIYADNKSEYEFLQCLRRRAAETDKIVINKVTEIINRIKDEGDSALLEYSERFDGAKAIKRFTKKDFRKAYNNADEGFRKALEEAAKRITAFHKKQVKKGYVIEQNGCMVGQIVKGLDRVGIYVPGGTAAYPSSVLMNTIPAKLAKVGKIVMVSPPPKNGKVNEDILTAAYIAGVDELLLVGGAQAVAALAYGTKSIERVDKIVGPGNIYVATAKRLVYGVCDIDMVAGPSEIMIAADADANPAYIAADLLSQAEHDTLASSILVTTSSDIAAATLKELERQAALLPRMDIIQASLDNYGGIIVCDSLDKLIELINITAPEHLELLLDRPFECLDRVKNAGSVFLGAYSPEPLGDYFAGTNHVLPTGGTARFYSPLSVDSFIKKIQYVYYTQSELQKAGSEIICIAEKEGLQAHAAAIKARLK